jgi:ABC-type transporter Mla MlaB component
LIVCSIMNQTIDNHGFTVSYRSDVVGGFSISDQKSVSFVPNDIGVNFPYLMYFSVVNCSLMSLSDNIFRTLPKLKTLRLSNNRISKIDSGTLDNLANVIEIFMDHNEIKLLDENIFKNLSELKNISLSNNKLETIPAPLFKNNPNLEWIWLQNNKLKQINFETFDSIIKLLYIDLRGNDCVDLVYNQIHPFLPIVPRIQIELKDKCVPYDCIKEMSEKDVILNGMIHQLETCKSNFSSSMEEVDGKTDQLETCEAKLRTFTEKKSCCGTTLADLFGLNFEVFSRISRLYSLI